MDEMSLDSHIAEFREIVDAIYGTYLDACEGFRHVRRHSIEVGEDIERSYQSFMTTHPELAHLPLGELRRIKVLLEENLEKLLEAWHGHIGAKR